MFVQPKLLDVWLKLEWAQHHTDTLNEHIRRWLESQRQELTAWFVTTTLDRHHRRFIVAFGSVALPAAWMLMIGDIVYNVRAALNYLAWDLVRAGLKPKPKRPQDVEFPIFTDRDKFYDSLGKRLPGVLPEHLAVIERHQPYSLACHIPPVVGPAQLNAISSHP